MYLATHYPKSEHLDDLLDSMRRLGEAARSLPGLVEVGAFRQGPDSPIYAVSIWASQEAFEAGVGEISAAVADVPFDEWEERPPELHVLAEVTLPT